MDTTEQLLSAITDPGVFERVANAVLRVRYPDLAELVQPGVNENGKTRKAPVDAIHFVSKIGSARLVMVQHTTADLKGLRSKWLHDPKKDTGPVSKPASQSAGDILKAHEIALDERGRTVGLSVKLFLTTNREPDQKLVRDAIALGASLGIEVHVLSRSAIAHVLDTVAEGQSIRHLHFGVSQRILSWDLIRRIGKQSLVHCHLADDREARVRTRTSDELTRLRQPLTFLVGASGCGKSVAAQEWLHAAMEDEDVACIVLRESTVETAPTLDRAIETEFRSFCPDLNPGVSVTAFCVGRRRLRIVVEDVAASTQRMRIIEKLMDWAGATASSDRLIVAGWMLVCPVQPWILKAVSKERATSLDRCTKVMKGFVKSEAVEAYIRRASSAGIRPTSLEASRITSALGFDPLLIALHDPNTVGAPSEVIGTYVRTSIEEFANGGEAKGVRAEEVLWALGRQMLIRRNVAPTYKEVMTWFSDDWILGTLHAMLDHRGVMWIERLGQSTELRFRHDRVRDWILSECIRQAMELDELQPEVEAEPYYAELVGAAAARLRPLGQLIGCLLRTNPLAAFHAYGSVRSEDDRHSISLQLEAWLQEPENTKPSNRTLLRQAQRLLVDLEHRGVARLVSLFPERTWDGDLASFRNGDIKGGLRLCSEQAIGTSFPSRDNMVAHVAAKQPEQFDEDIAAILTSSSSSRRMRAAAFFLAGLSGHSTLGGVIAGCWKSESQKGDYLAEYIWSAARCFDGEGTVRVLDDAFSDIESMGEQRDVFINLKLDRLRLGFSLHPPRLAVDYLLQRAESEKLRHFIAWTLGEIDDPRTVRFKAAWEASVLSRHGLVVNDMRSHWERRARKGDIMSPASRSCLAAQWQDGDIDDAERRIALAVWATCADPSDMEVLAGLENDRVLRDTALRARLSLHDPSAEDLVIGRLRAGPHPFMWLWLADQLPADGVLREIPEILKRRGDHPEDNHNDWEWAARAGDLLTRGDSRLAAKILLETWPSLGRQGPYVQAALFLGGGELQVLADEAVRSAEDPSALFEFVTNYFVGGINGHRGAAAEDQFRRLLPYLSHISAPCRAELRSRCEDRGWKETAAQFSDESRHAWGNAEIRPRLDALMAERSGYRWLEGLKNALDRDLDRSILMYELKEWLAVHPTLAALGVGCTILREVGTRSELDLLDRSLAASTAQGADAVSDTAYAVRRRTLHE